MVPINMVQTEVVEEKKMEEERGPFTIYSS